MRYFVTAIGTDSGKTVVSAIITQALHGDYWKPIQAGYPTDTDTVKQLVKNPISRFFNETYLFNKAASPHEAAQDEGVEISMRKIKIPKTNNDLIIEGAGGLMVPLNDQDFIIDLIPRFDAEVILVADLYLGSINHTLLTVDMLKKRKFKVKGIVFNGESNSASEETILKYSQYPCLLKIKKERVIDQNTINRYALELLERWHDL